MSKIYDIIVFGASGYTGQFVLEKLVKKLLERPGLKVAIAGRSREKLLASLKECHKQTSIEFVSKIPIITADVSDSMSLSQMAKQGRVVINCVGPYALYGEAVIEACIQSGTHHLDISGESLFLETVQLHYTEAARSNNVYIIGSCALLSAVTELGVQFTEEKFQGQLNEVESYLTFKRKTSSPLHYGTWHSLIVGLGNHRNLLEIRKQLYPTKLPEFTHVQKKRGFLFYEPTIKKWAIPFPSADRAIVYRTQRYLVENENKPNPVQYISYIGLPNLLSALFLVFAGLYIFLAASFSFTRSLLINFPRIMSAGMVSHEGPSRKVLDQASFSLTCIGKGWSKDRTGKPESIIKTQLEGQEEGGYYTTAACCVEAACCILEEGSKLPKLGGVYTTGVALKDTTFLERMQKTIKFSILDDETDSKKK